MLCHDIVSLLVQISATNKRPFALLVKFEEWDVLRKIRTGPIWACPTLSPGLSFTKKMGGGKPGDEVGRGSGSFDL